MTPESDGSAARPPTRRSVLLLYGTVAVVVCAALALGGLLDVRARVLFGDPNGIAEQPSYVGVISQLGVLTWAGGAAMLLLVAWVRRDRFAASWGALTAGLAVDDAIQVHDKALVEVETLAVAVIGLTVLATAWRFRAELRATVARTWFASAAALLTLSALIDLPKLAVPGSGVAEELCKTLGIAGWTVACGVLARERLGRP